MAAVSLHVLAEVGQFLGGLASLAVLASIYFVWREIEQRAQDGRVELITGMTSLIGSVSQVFIEHPKMRKYFYEGAEPDGDDLEMARAIAMRMADALDHVTGHLDLMSEPSQEAWRQYVADIGRQSPTLKGYVRAHKSWYRPELWEQLGLD
jgi:hypothetical protein